MAITKDYISGKGAPDENVVGKIGQAYLDTNTGDYFKCVRIHERHGYKKNSVRYIWEKVDKEYGNVQSDMNEPNPTSPAYVKNAHPIPYGSMPDGYPKNVVIDIEWNGNTEGLVSSSTNEMFKVSDNVYTRDELIGATRSTTLDDGRVKTYIITDEEVVEEDNVIDIDDYSIIITLEDNINYYDEVFPKKGIYFASWTSEEFPEEGIVMPGGHISKLSIPSIERMSEDFMPLPIPYSHMPEGYPKDYGFNIEWDGNTEGLILAGTMMYKVSDTVLTTEDLIGATYYTRYSDGNERNYKITKYDIKEGTNAISNRDGEVIVALEDNAEIFGMVLPKKGIYFIGSEGYYTFKLFKDAIERMSEDFMPLLTSPNGTKYKITVDDTGVLSAVKVTE